MNNTLIQSLIKSKSNQGSTVEELIDSYLKEVAKTNRKQTEEFVADLLVYVMQRVEELDKEQLMALVESKLVHLNYTVDSDTVEQIYTKTVTEASAEVAFAFAFDRVDTQVIESVNRSLVWLQEDGTLNTQSRVKEVLNRALEGELSIADIGATLREEFKGVVDKSEQYFTDVSDHIIRQSQSLGRVYAFSKAGVEYVQAIAKIDSKTSLICRSMHMKLIPIAHLVSQADSISNAQTIEEKKAVARWQSQPIFGTLPKEVGMSPYHFKCRTIMRAYFPQKTEVDGKNVNGSYLPEETFKEKEVLFSHVDRFGYERVVADATVEHESFSTKPKSKEMIAGLNSLESLALHKHDPLRTVGFSKDKGLVYVFEGEYVVTVIKADVNYFMRNAEPKSVQSLSLKKGESHETV